MLVSVRGKKPLLYKLSTTNERFDGIEPIAFKDIASFGQLEKDLENLIAQNIFGVLFEDARLLPIWQEKQGQKAADIYALNEVGDLTIFELKRRTAGEDAVHQALRYSQDAGQWTHARLQDMFRKHSGDGADLAKAHREAFDLDHSLGVRDFNRRQHLVVIGSAADDSLIAAVDYWRTRGISIDFLPYRIYELAGERYFEFFALPYDRHTNPARLKGVLFDTNQRYSEESIWYMMENRRVAAFGDAKINVQRVNVGDFVFFSHRWTGIVAAAKVRPGKVKTDGPKTLYRDVEFITPVPQRGAEPNAMPFRMVQEIIGQNFFWAATIKRPYLSYTEAQCLADALKQYLVEGD